MIARHRTRLPAKRDALYERAYTYSIHRVTSGAAYPSDAEGGHITATLAVHAMMQKPAFRADYEISDSLPISKP